MAQKEYVPILETIATSPLTSLPRAEIGQTELGASRYAAVLGPQS